jgi:YHS domain-containing protein
MLLRHNHWKSQSFAIKTTRKGGGVVGRGETPMLICVGAKKFERAMTTIKTSFVAAALLLGGATLAAATTTGEFDNECVMGLALGKDIETDCSVNTVFNGKTYCLGNEQAKTIFLKKPEEFLTRAQVYYSSKGQ